MQVELTTQVKSDCRSNLTLPLKFTFFQVHLKIIQDPLTINFSKKKNNKLELDDDAFYLHSKFFA